MCRMIGFSFKEDQDTLKLFEGLKRMAKNGVHSPHTEGWGEYLINSNKDVLFYKSLTEAYNDYQENFKACMGIMHARKASPNLPKERLQLHPFVNGNTVFAHNGTIRNIDINNPFSSDSYELFKLIKDFDKFDGLAKNIKRFILDYNFTAINFLMIKGKTLYVLQMFSEDEKYYTLWYHKDKNGVVVSSEGLDDSYKPIKNGELLSIKDSLITRKMNVLEA